MGNLSQTEKKMMSHLSDKNEKYDMEDRIFIIYTKDKKEVVKKVLPKRMYGNSICIYNSDKRIIDKYDPVIYVFSDDEEIPIIKEKYDFLNGKNLIKRIGKYENKHLTITQNQYRIMNRYADMYGITMSAMIDEICGKMKSEIENKNKKDQDIYF